MKKLLFSLSFLLCAKAQAGVLLELAGTYISDNLTSSATQSSTEYFYSGAALFSLNKQVWGGWNFSGVSMSKTQGTSTSFAAADTGPYMKWQFGKGDIFSLAGAYNIVSRATFSDGTTSENWEGTSLWLQFGVAPEVRTNLRVGVSLNYYLATYTKKTVDSIESRAANSKSWIFPLLSISKEW